MRTGRYTIRSGIATLSSLSFVQQASNCPLSQLFNFHKAGGRAHAVPFNRLCGKVPPPQRVGDSDRHSGHFPSQPSSLFWG